MQRITVLCVGKLKETYWRDAIEEYRKRLGTFCKLTFIEVAEERLPESPSAAQIAQTLTAEGQRLLSHIPAGAAVVAMCIEGEMRDSKDLSAILSRWAVQGVSDVVFIIGGSYGLSDAVKSVATLKLSMSPMTFPHQLARVMLSEQLYRAFQIAGGGKYHK